MKNNPWLSVFGQVWQVITPYQNVSVRFRDPISQQLDIVESWRLRHSTRNEKLIYCARLLSSLERFLTNLHLENRFWAFLAIFRPTLLHKNDRNSRSSGRRPTILYIRDPRDTSNSNMKSDRNLEHCQKKSIFFEFPAKKQILKKNFKKISDQGRRR